MVELQKIMRKLIIVYSIILITACSTDAGTDRTDPEVQLLESINSAVVAFEFQSSEMENFLSQPDRAYISGYFMFEEDLADDVIFGLDIEWFEGVNNPLNFEGADWMGLAGIDRNGILWYPEGLPTNIDGTPTEVTNWQIKDLGFIPEPNTWYQMRIEVDFSKLEFVSFSISGDGVQIFEDLTGEQLDYPNFIPFDEPSITLYTFSLRSKEFAPENEGSAKVFFDDIESGIWDGQQWVSTFTNGFENQNEVVPIPVELPVIPMDNITENTWYFENDDAKTTIVSNNARSGSFSLMCDADLTVSQ